MLCCACVLQIRWFVSFQVWFVGSLVRSSRLVGSFVRLSRFYLLVHSLARLAACVQDELSRVHGLHKQITCMPGHLMYMHIVWREREGKRDRQRNQSGLIRPFAGVKLLLSSYSSS